VRLEQFQATLCFALGPGKVCKLSVNRVES
jgi:hypothetical protein